MAISIIQNWQGDAQPGNFDFIFLTGAQRGNQLICMFFLYAGGAPITSPVVSDNFDNIWLQAVSGGNDFTGILYIYYCQNNNTTGDVIVEVHSQSSNRVEIFAGEFSFGLGQIMTLGQVSHVVGTVSSNLMTSGPVTVPAVLPELIVGILYSQSGTITNGEAGWNVVLNPRSTSTLAENLIESVGGIFSATGNQSDPLIFLGAAATFSVLGQIPVDTSCLNITDFTEVYPQRVKEDIYDSLANQTGFHFIQFGPSYNNPSL